MKIAFTLLVVLSVLCCTEKSKFEPVRGHWVSVDYLEGKSFATFDIEDSMVTFNQFGINSSHYPFWPKENHYEAIYSYDFWEIAFVIVKKADTLFQIQKDDTVRFVQVGKKSLYKEEVFCDSIT